MARNQKRLELERMCWENTIFADLFLVWNLKIHFPSFLEFSSICALCLCCDRRILVHHALYHQWTLPLIEDVCCTTFHGIWIIIWWYTQWRDWRLIFVMNNITAIWDLTHLILLPSLPILKDIQFIRITLFMICVQVLAKSNTTWPTRVPTVFFVCNILYFILLRPFDDSS